VERGIIVQPSHSLLEQCKETFISLKNRLNCFQSPRDPESVPLMSSNQEAEHSEGLLNSHTDPNVEESHAHEVVSIKIQIDQTIRQEA
jgi:hypothetical protein